jgi:hypothetical protein
MRKRYLRPDGGAVPALLTANVLRGPDREILFALATVEPTASAEHDLARPDVRLDPIAMRDTSANPGVSEVDRIRRAMLD